MVNNSELYQKWMELSREIRMSGGHGHKKHGRHHHGPRFDHGMRPVPGPCFRGGMPNMPMPGFRGGMPNMPGFRPGMGMGPQPMPHFRGRMPGMPPMPPRPHHGRGPGRGSWESRERLLVIIGNHPEGMWQKDLAREAGINPSSASEVISRLEADGFLTRTADEQDRRAVRLELTEKGKTRAEEIKAEREDRLEDIFSKLTEEEKETLFGLLEKLMS